jgi:Zn-dependent peptidase ImmA (M78 family)
VTTSPPRVDLSIKVARAVVSDYKRKANLQSPPMPVEELARWIGFQVHRLYTLPDEFSALVSTRDRLIGVNGHHPMNRQRYSICHELGHILLGHPPENITPKREIARLNVEADICASELLIPSTLLKPFLGHTESARELARIFSVSEEAMRRRLDAAAITQPAA